jgi:hypothetical protein
VTFFLQFVTCPAQTCRGDLCYLNGSISGLEITRIASQFATHVRCYAIKILHRSRLRCKVTEVTYGEAIVFSFIHLSHLKFSIVFLIAENTFCHKVTITIPCSYSRPMSNPAAARPAPAGPAIIESSMVELGC